jgi:hypothetical protein
MAATAMKEGRMQHYYAICEQDGAGGFWISFPGRNGLGSAADSAWNIVAQAQDALETLLMPPPAILPLSIEAGAKPPADLSEFESPLVVVIPFEPAAVAKEAA